MAKLGKNAPNEQEGKETVEFFKDLDREALNTERFLEKYQKPLSAVFVGLVVGVLAYFGYQQFIVAPNNA
ncbi:MAG TPA: tetratricopeptide repeat protein, partial [Chryseobacterium sp.]